MYSLLFPLLWLNYLTKSNMRKTDQIPYRRIWQPPEGRSGSKTGHTVLSGRKQSREEVEKAVKLKICLQWPASSCESPPPKGPKVFQKSTTWVQVVRSQEPTEAITQTTTPNCQRTHPWPSLSVGHTLHLPLPERLSHSCLDGSSLRLPRLIFTPYLLSWSPPRPPESPHSPKFLPFTPQVISGPALGRRRGREREFISHMPH